MKIVIIPGVGVAMAMAFAPVGVAMLGVIMEGVAPCGVRGVPKYMVN